MGIEYPESTVISGQMRQVLPERTITGVAIRDANAVVFRWGFSNLNQIDLRGSQINHIRQFGDTIFVELGPYALVFSDMIGKILYHRPTEKRPPKAAITLELDDGAAISYNPSLYGYCKALTPAETAAFAPATWVQPLDDAFTADYLGRAFAEPERKIAKQMNVFNVAYKAAGVGNGYWQEILFLSGVRPERKARDITPEEIGKLHANTRQVMRSAIEKGGSAEEKDFFNASGGYVRRMGGRLKGQPCSVCGETIQGKHIMGANVYFCPHCQR